MNKLNNKGQLGEVMIYIFGAIFFLVGLLFLAAFLKSIGVEILIDPETTGIPQFQAALMNWSLVLVIIGLIFYGITLLLNKFKKNK